jgi:hypothetical protein
VGAGSGEAARAGSGGLASGTSASASVDAGTGLGASEERVRVLAAESQVQPSGPAYGAQDNTSDAAAAAAAAALRFDLDAAVNAVLHERLPGTAVDALQITRHRYKPHRDAARDLFTLVGILENISQLLFRAPGNRHDTSKHWVRV